MRMRTTLAASLLLLAASAVASFPSVARADEVTGCDCSNMCPLAQEANHHRSTGGEAVLASKLVRADCVRVVLKNLATL